MQARPRWLLVDQPDPQGARIAREALVVSLLISGTYLVLGFKWFFLLAFGHVLDAWGQAFWWPLYRYGVATVLFLALPWWWLRRHGLGTRSVGWGPGHVKRGLILTAIGALVILGIWPSVVADPAMHDIYPPERVFVDPAFGPFNPAGFVVMEVLYVVAYYIPYEFFFRGFMQFPLVDHGKVRVAWVVMLSTAITTAAHWDVPVMELVAALAVGLVYGLAALWCRSTWYGLINHVAVGLVTNIACLLVLQGII